MMEEPANNKTIENTSSEREKVIEITDLRISFGDQLVLKNVSIDLFKGENLIILGKSGSGKSVLIKCIASLLSPDSGLIKVLGEDITKLGRKELAAMRKKIGFLFQGGALYDSMTVKENLEFPLQRTKKKKSAEEINKKIIEALENVGLPDVLNKMPSELSGGMRKRIALARTIVVDPLIMLYDEPTTGLDPITSAEISKLINEVQDKYKTSSIIITHDIACAREIADRVIMINDGEIYSEGTMQEHEQSDDPWIKSFFNQ